MEFCHFISQIFLQRHSTCIVDMFATVLFRHLADIVVEVAYLSTVCTIMFFPLPDISEVFPDITVEVLCLQTCLPEFCFLIWQTVHRGSLPVNMFATVLFLHLVDISVEVPYLYTCLPQFCFFIWQSFLQRFPTCRHVCHRSVSPSGRHFCRGFLPVDMFATVLFLHLADISVEVPYLYTCSPQFCFFIGQTFLQRFPTCRHVCHSSVSSSGRHFCRDCHLSRRRTGFPGHHSLPRSG